MKGECESDGCRLHDHTWYFDNNVLQTPVSSIMATKNGITALFGIVRMAEGGGSWGVARVIMEDGGDEYPRVS